MTAYLTTLIVTAKMVDGRYQNNWNVRSSKIDNKMLLAVISLLTMGGMFKAMKWIRAVHHCDCTRKMKSD
jgi:hypothetical protein